MNDAEFLRSVERADLPGVSAVIVNRESELYSHSEGLADTDTGLAMTADTPCQIASCTKAITSLAAMQMVEQGKLELDAPIGVVLPQLSDPQVIVGWGKDGVPQTRPAKNPIALRHLLTHTAGLGYAFLDQDVLHYLAFAGMPAQGSIASIATPLMFDPGSDWAYSIATDWVGLAVQNASGETLGDYLKRHIFGPLGMHSSGFRAHKLDGDASVHRRLPGGGFATDPIALRGEEYEIGGGGLVSTARDYGRFLQAMLRGGELDGNRLIQNATFEEMTKPQTGTLRAGRMDSIMPELSGTFDMFPDQHTAWSLGFLVNPEEGPDGRAAGSQSWAGIFNSYYWFDRETDRAGFFTAQLLPFADERAINAFRALERLAYS